jgi:PAS domain S-box-containing protein
LKKLGENIDALITHYPSVIAQSKKSMEPSQQLNASLTGIEALSRIQMLIADFENEEKQLLQERVVENEVHITEFNTGFFSFVLATGAALMLIFYTINNQLKPENAGQRESKTVSNEVRDLYDNATWGYHSVNPQGEFIDINNTLLKWLGYHDRTEVVGKLKFTDIISAEELKIFEANNPALFEKGFINDLEFNLIKKDGTKFPVVMNSTAVVDGRGNFIESKSNTFDNTARKLAETKMQEMQQELEAFSYSVSHDLRAPLRSIDGYSRALKEDYFDKLDNEGKRVIDVIMNNTNRMNQLINDLLDFARLGRKDVALAQVDMTNVVQSVVNELVQQENGRNIDVVVHPLNAAAADIDMIRQVWTNLISNAIKYTGKTPEPKIEISSYTNEQEVMYQVIDNGVGFDMRYADKLFGVFQRLHKMQEFRGTGVGLAIVKRIVSRHHGRVWAEAKLNSGAKFYFTIPK